MKEEFISKGLSIFKLYYSDDNLLTLLFIFKNTILNTHFNYFEAIPTYLSFASLP